jgi:hypothetical protein
VGTGVVVRHLIRSGLACGALLLGVLILGARTASAQTVTFGAPLSQAPDTSLTCPGDPDGGFQITHPNTCTWAEGDNPTATSEGFITPAGTGTITSVRIRVGATTGPMELVVLTLEFDPSNGNTSCCTAAYVSPPFTPTANSITTLNTDLPVRTDPDGTESAPPYQVGDMLGLSILEGNVPIPAIVQESGPENDWPSDSILWPAFTQNQTAVMGGYLGYQLDMNATWVSGVSTPVPTPTVTVGSSKPTVKHNKADVGLTCGTAAACDGTIAIENQPLAGATAASVGEAKKAIVYAKGSFNIKAGKHATIAVPLKSKGKTAAKRHKRLTVYIDITIGSHKQSKKVTFRF